MDVPRRDTSTGQPDFRAHPSELKTLRLASPDEIESCKAIALQNTLHLTLVDMTGEALASNIEVNVKQPVGELFANKEVDTVIENSGASRLECSVLTRSG